MNAPTRLPMRALLVLPLAFALAPAADAQRHATASLFVRAEGDDVKAAVEIVIDPGWHLYHGPTEAEKGGPGAVGTPTTVKMVGDGFAWSEARYPEPERVEQVFGETRTWIFEHHGSMVLFLRGRMAEGADLAALQAKVKGLTCDVNGCLPYSETVASKGRGSDALFAQFPADLVAPEPTADADPASGAGAGASEESPPSGTDPAAEEGAGVSDPVAAGESERAEDWSEVGAGDLASLPLAAFLWSAVLWGLFALLMPCTYPMIPITISYFTKQASQRHTSLLPLALTYGAGIVLIFVAIGVVVGEAIIRVANNGWFNLVIGLLFVFFALSLFGAILLQPPQFMMGWVGKATKTGGYLGVFLLGALLVVTSFTCTAPFVGSLLAAGAADGERARVVMGMGTFGLTMAVPFVALAMVPGRVKSLPRSGEWMHTLKVTLGFVEIAAALKFFSNAELVWQWRLLPRELFLWLWAGICLITGLYLLGIVRLKDDAEPGEEAARGIGSGRLIAGTAVALFATYCGYGAAGNKVHWILAALAPPYSERFDYETEPQIVYDDFDGAITLALAEHKQVLINFTGFT